MENITIEELNGKFDELHDLRDLINDYKDKKEEFSNGTRITNIDGIGSTFQLVILDDDSAKKYSDEVIRLTLDYLNKAIYDKTAEYMDKYAILEEICSNIKGLDFSDKLIEYKL